MTFRLVLLAAVLPLAACNSQPSVEASNASAGEVAQQVADAGGGGAFIKAGKWRTTIAIEDLQIDGVKGMPAGMTESIKRQMSATRSIETCVTPEQASKPNADFFGADSTCKYDRFAMAGGTIDAAMTCDQGGRTLKTRLKGTYGPDSYDIRGTSEQSGEMAMKMTVHTKAERVGACDAG